MLPVVVIIRSSTIAFAKYLMLSGIWLTRWQIYSTTLSKRSAMYLTNGPLCIEMRRGEFAAETVLWCFGNSSVFNSISFALLVFGSYRLSTYILGLNEMLRFFYFFKKLGPGTFKLLAAVLTLPVIFLITFFFLLLSSWLDFYFFKSSAPRLSLDSWSVPVISSWNLL